MAAIASRKSKDSVEVIEWDIPDSDHSPDHNIDFRQLSVGTEVQSKMWQSENKMMFNTYQPTNSLLPPQLVDHNQNLSNGLSRFVEDYQSLKLDNGYAEQHHSTTHKNCNESPFSKYQPQFMPHQKYNSPMEPSQKIQQMLNGKEKSKAQPLLQSSADMGSDRKSPQLLSQKENCSDFDERRLNESQTIKEELLEMKSIFTKLAATSEDILGLPEPVQLALKVIKLEGQLQDKDNIMKVSEDKVFKLNTEIEKLKSDYNFQLEKQNREVNFLHERLEYKANLDAKLKEMAKTNDNDISKEALEILFLKDQLEKVGESKDKTIKQLDDWKKEHEHKVRTLETELSVSQKEIKRYKTLLTEQETSQQNKKTELDKYITAAREAMERERQDRYLLLVEQNKLKHKVDKLSETCKSYQLKNEEQCRIQNELEQECDQFRKLKKMIQEHGLPNHEQLILLQQQTEMFKDDVLSERKDRERAQAQREKLRRDLEILQSRNQSLQEQVYKYQEHIMRLNTGNGRYQQDYPQQNPVKFTRQFSSPAYYNPKIRGSTVQLGKLNINSGSISPQGNEDTQNSPINEMNLNRSGIGFGNNYQMRGGNSRNSPSFNSTNQFDPWQMKSGIQQPSQQQQQQQRQLQFVQQRANTNSIANINRAPRSPLLDPNGDPWILSAATTNINHSQPPTGQMNPEISYSDNIWSLQAPASPTAFNSVRTTAPSTQSKWEFSSESTSIFTSSQPHGVSSGIKKIRGDVWSTAIEDIRCGENSQENGTNSSSPGSSEHGPSSTRSIGDNRGEINNESGSAIQTTSGFQCRKCNIKFQDTEMFRAHVEKCFN